MTYEDAADTSLQCETHAILNKHQLKEYSSKL